MKKLSFMVLFAFIFNLIFLQTISFADNVDTQLDDATKNSTQETTKQLADEFKFKTFNSCEDMQKVMSDFASTYKINYFRPRYYMLEDKLLGATNDMAVSNATQAEGKSESVTSSTTDFSKTNIQVKGVDEPEIIKTDGKHIYYYNAKLAKIYIIQSPLDISSAKIDLSTANVLKEIKIPSNLSNIQLFIFKNRLVILANRYSEQNYYETILDKSNRTNVAIYDTSDINNLKLVKLYDTYWYYQDARMIDNQLYLVSQLDLRLYYAWATKPMFWWLLQDSTLSLKTSDIMPKSMEISYTKDSKEQNVKWLPYNISSKTSDCKDIFYLMPNKESIEKYNVSPSFAIVSKIDVDSYDKEVDTKTVFGSIAQLHMTEKSLYISNNFYVGYNFSCPYFARCIMPSYNSWENTLVHKFDLDTNKSLKYNNSNIIPWSPLNQYSMSEDSEWYFRILTSTWSPKNATHLFILDKALNLYWSLKNIEPGENFKSSRFMWNMLYLVTFEQIDPLFVIDLSNKKTPKIVWELKMPWYSTYLHPYDEMKDWIQYIIWIWYDTKPTQWWGVSNAWIKLDLYKIDYNKKQTPQEKCNEFAPAADSKYSDCIAQFSWSSLTWNYISVDQVKSLIIWDKGSWTEALENPRMFVFDSKRKVLILPIILQKQEIKKVCSKDYLGKEYCYDNYNYTPTFAWLKWYTIDKTNWIIESISKDYKDIIDWASDYSNSYNSEWGFRALNFRVWYLWDAIYGINNLFADFFILGKESVNKSIYLDENADPKKCEEDKPVCGQIYVECVTYPCNPIKKTFKNRCELWRSKSATFLSEWACKVETTSSSSSSSTDEKQCTYTPPAEWAITCEMYCGKRWVLGSDNKCSEVEISAACSCPGFDTKDSCEKTCEK